MRMFHEHWTMSSTFARVVWTAGTEIEADLEVEVEVDVEVDVEVEVEVE